MVTPFGASPPIESVLGEMNSNTGSDVDAKIVDLRAGLGNDAQIEKGLLKFSQEGDSILSLCRMMFLTDSANCYASLLCGKPTTVEKCVRIQLSYLRDLLGAIYLTLIDKYFNMSDSSTNDRGGNHLILLNFLRFGYFKIGFLGRKITQERKSQEKAVASHAEERKPR